MTRPRIKEVKFAVDEHIWGHRLYDEQLPHLAVLEFLGVLGGNLDSPLIEPTDKTVEARPQRQIRLRGLLFNNPYIESIRARSISDREKWSSWKELFIRDATGHGDEKIDHLQSAFNTFDDFARAVELLRSSAFEANSNKRWSSKFVFPFGPDALYEDLRFESSGPSNDRRFFARTGELLYLMLCRASRGAELGEVLVRRLFNADMPMNKLVRTLQGEPQYVAEPRSIGYLPHHTHKRFDRLCNDWLSILSRDMPVYDALEHLITNAGLNLLLYFLECGKSEAGDVDPVQIICEIVSKDRTKVRALSGDSYQHNQAISLRAVRASVESIRLMPEWAQALKSDDPKEACADLMQARYQWPPLGREDPELVEHETGDELVEKLVENALDRHGQHFGKIHSAWSRAIGLSSRRLSRRTRYAPNDRLLKTLVVSIVDERMQFDEFLHELYVRYGIVVGDTEGIQLIRTKQVDQGALSDNRAKLESRLMSLGLVRRLSDSCSFVENPFATQGGE